MVPNGHKFLTEEKDPRQWDHHIAFGSTKKFPDTLGRKPLAVYNQEMTDFCTAYSSAGAQSFAANFPVSPEFQTAKEGEISGAPILQGASMDTPCDAMNVFGYIPQDASPLSLQNDGEKKIADWKNYPTSLNDIAIKNATGGYYRAHTGPYDAFDNIRSSIMKAHTQGQEIAVIMGTPWYNEFNIAASKKEVMPLPSIPPVSEHAWVIFDWKPDGKGDFNALALLSQGENFGVQGVLEFPRHVINFLMANKLSDTRVIEKRGKDTWNTISMLLHYLHNALANLSYLLSLESVKKLLHLGDYHPDRTLGAARSPQWPKVRDAYLKAHPTCELCGEKKALNVHHVQDFSTYPALELDPSNFIALCRDHHLLAGHLMNWSSINPDVREDAAHFLEEIKNRR